MSSFFILENEASSTPTSDVDKAYVDNQDKKLLDLACTRSLKDDLVLETKAILGIQDISASNSVSSKGYIDRELAKKANIKNNSSPIGVGTPTANTHATTKKYCDDKFITMPKPSSDTTLTGNLDLNLSYTIKKVKTPTSASDVSTKAYVDSEKTSLKTELSTLMDTKIAAIHPMEFHVHGFGQDAMATTNTWYHMSFPLHSARHSPHAWFWVKGLTERSYFKLLTMTFDGDDSLPSRDQMKMSWKLDVFDANGWLRTWTFLDQMNMKNYRVPGELLFCIGEKRFWKDFPSGGGADNYKTFTVGRLSCKRHWSGSWGSETNASFMIAI